MEKIKCEVTTLDAFVQEQGIGKVDIIKIDVEGNERAVLEGGAVILKKYHPVVYCELLRKHAARFGYHPDEVLDFMGELCYACYVLRDGKLEAFERMTEETKETNFFFLPVA